MKFGLFLKKNVIFALSKTETQGIGKLFVCVFRCLLIAILKASKCFSKKLDLLTFSRNLVQNLADSALIFLSFPISRRLKPTLHFSLSNISHCIQPCVFDMIVALWLNPIIRICFAILSKNHETWRMKHQLFSKFLRRVEATMYCMVQRLKNSLPQS
jgi:hypothetical protein